MTTSRTENNNRAGELPGKGLKVDEKEEGDEGMMGGG